MADLPKRKVFISHRHADENIANVLRGQLQIWGLPDENLLQSSNYKHEGKIGRPIPKHVCNFLLETKLFILIYSVPDGNWEYTIWECGLVNDLASESTQTVVIQCIDEKAGPFWDDRRILLNPADIMDFTQRFHTENGFFPEMSAYQPKIRKEVLKARSRTLYKALDSVRPTLAILNKEVRWGYFTLEVSPEHVSRLKESENEQIAMKRFRNIQDRVYVVKVKGWGLRHFNYYGFDPDITLGSLIRRWKLRMKALLGLSGRQRLKRKYTHWISDLQLEICRAVRNGPPTLSWNPLQSVNPHTENWLVSPVVNVVRYLSDGSIQIDIYMYDVTRLANK